MTAPDPRVGEIEARLAAISEWPDILPMPQADVAYLLAELRKRDEALARVEGLAERWATLAEGDRYYARRLRAAITPAGGG